MNEKTNLSDNSPRNAAHLSVRCVNNSTFPKKKTTTYSPPFLFHSLTLAH